MHLLWILPRGMPCWCHCWRAQLWIFNRDSWGYIPFNMSLLWLIKEFIPKIHRCCRNSCTTKKSYLRMETAGRLRLQRTSDPRAFTVKMFFRWMGHAWKKIKRSVYGSRRYLYSKFCHLVNVSYHILFFCNMLKCNMTGKGLETQLQLFHVCRTFGFMECAENMAIYLNFISSRLLSVCDSQGQCNWRRTLDLLLLPSWIKRRSGKFN